MNVWEMKLPTGPGVLRRPIAPAPSVPLLSQIVHSAEKSDMEQGTPPGPAGDHSLAKKFPSYHSGNS